MTVLVTQSDSTDLNAIKGFPGKYSPGLVATDEVHAVFCFLWSKDGDQEGSEVEYKTVLYLFNWCKWSWRKTVDINVCSSK